MKIIKIALPIISIFSFVTMKAGTVIRMIGLFAVLTVCLLAGCQSEKIKPTVKPFDSSWESLARYECPQWFRDAKLGIYVHWGVYSVAEYGEWYCRTMYETGGSTNKYHLQKFGHPTEFEYRDLIPMWKAEKFDADAWLELFKEAGARYFTPCAVHHDGFDLWNSKHHTYNAVIMGPKKDLIGMMRDATKKAHLRWGCTTHLSRNYSWVQTCYNADTEGSMKGIPYVSNTLEARVFYHEPHGDTNHRQPINPPEYWKKEWIDRMRDLIDNYQPDYLFFDGAIPFAGDDGQAGRTVMAHFYNNALSRYGSPQAVITIKKIENHGIYRGGVSTIDVERGKLDKLCPEPWQTDDSVGPWGYRAGATYKKPGEVIDKFIDIVSKNGNLLLNVPPMADGTFDDATVNILRELGKWNRQNGEAIFGTRPWMRFGEGDMRFTRSKDGTKIYVLFLEWPTDGRVTIRSLAPWEGAIDGEISEVKLLGSERSVKHRLDSFGLHIELPEQTNQYAVALKISLDGWLTMRSPLVPIVVSPSSSYTELIAAGELAAGLARTYPAYQFDVIEEKMSTGPFIQLGCRNSWTKLSEDVAARLEGPESYVVSREVVDGRTVGQIVGEDPAGAAYGAYELLKRLGHGLYLSFETQPEPHDIFDFEDWDLADRPLCRRRFVLNWHNFLSGCSTWNVEDWNLWTTRLQKLGYNGVMVHAYGNNPMAGFTFRGVQKPVGYLSSTQVGRDWSTNHVADVRNLYGGELFDTPIFGSTASVDGSDRHRTEAAQTMMAKSFEHAHQRGVDVYFALDVGTASANPQELIGLLSESARFRIKPRAFGRKLPEDEPFWLADPDTEEGYEFYKAQIEHLMKVYPQIDVLALWVRMQSTPWMGLELSELPPKWRKEYEQEIVRTPEAAKMWRSVGLFGVSKIARAVQRALTELERDDVTVGLGSWCFDYCPAADRFLPRDVELFPLDYRVLSGRSRLGTAERRKEIAPICNNRPVWPIVWAQHDDGHYVGPPYMPQDEFHGALQDAGVEGFGVIHWLNRPLDIYFESLARQTWKGTVDEPLATTCLRVAAQVFGPGEAERMGEYLLDWISNAPRIARETRDYFIDHELLTPAEIEPGIRSRLGMLESVDLHEASAGVRARVQYFQGFERFLLGVHRCEFLYHSAMKEKNAGRLDAARRTIAQAQPEQIIEAFARTTQLLDPTSGDLGLIVSMNTRWLTHYIALNQEIGRAPIRYDFSPTSHDPLAQVAGRFTFRFEPTHEVWQCYGERETGARVWSTEAADLPAVYRSGLVSNKPLTLKFQPMMRDVVDGDWNDATFPAGNYRMQLMFLEPMHEEAGKRRFDVTVHIGNKDQKIANLLDPFQEAGGQNRLCTIHHDLHLEAPGPVSISLAPRNGEVIICGAVFEPIDKKKKRNRYTQNDL